MKKLILNLGLPILILILFYNCKNDKKETETSEKKVAKTYATSLDKSIERGKLIYQDFCINCHQADGQGSSKVFPPLANSDYLRDYQKESLHGIKYGQSGEIVVNGITYNSVMQAQGLTDDEVADVMNYINNSWGNSYGKEYTEEDVAKIQK